MTDVAATGNRTVMESIKHYGTCQCAPFAWNKLRAAAATAVALGIIAAIVGALGHTNTLAIGSTGSIVTLALGGAALLTGLGITVREYLNSRKTDDTALSSADQVDTTPAVESSGWGCW